MKNKKVVIILDILLFKCLNNASLVELLKKEYFLLLWTSALEPTMTEYLHTIPYNAHISGLRNGCKPFKYVRLYLRRKHPDALCLPIIIVDFEKNYFNSRFGYDFCINVCDMVLKQNYNNRDINVIDVQKIFEQIELFVQQFSKTNISNIISRDDLLSDSIVLSSTDILQQQQPQQQLRKCVFNGKQQIRNKKCILTVGSSFFTLHHNVANKNFREFLKTCFLVVWMNNKNVNRMQIQNFIQTLKLNGIYIDYMLFGLDRNVKSISYIRKSIAPTDLPFILIDSLVNIYDYNKIDLQHLALCDFDFYINIDEYLVNGAFYNMNLVIEKINNYLNKLLSLVRTRPKLDRIKIVECTDDNDVDEDESDYPVSLEKNSAITMVDDEWQNRINHFNSPSIMKMQQYSKFAKRRKKL